MPVAFEVTPGLEADTKHLEPLVKDWKVHHPDLAGRTKVIPADNAYDDKENHETVKNSGPQLLLPNAQALARGRDQDRQPGGHGCSYG